MTVINESAIATPKRIGAEIGHSEKSCLRIGSTPRSVEALYALLMQASHPNDLSTSRDESRNRDVLGPLISTAFFGYYGFVFGLQTADDSGATVPLWIFSLWMLRIATLTFAVSLVLSFSKASAANMVYGAAGILGTFGLAAILIWDMLDPVHASFTSPLLLIIFIAWNGYFSFLTLRDAFR